MPISFPKVNNAAEISLTIMMLFICFVNLSKHSCAIHSHWLITKPKGEATSLCSLSLTEYGYLSK